MVATQDSGIHYDEGLPVEVPAALGVALTLVHERFEACGLCYGHGTDNAWDEAVQLVLSATGLPVEAGDEVLGDPITTEHWQTIRRWSYQRIAERTPLPYLTGTAWFAGLPFFCDPRALVPRSPLAEVIANEYQPWWAGPAPGQILDLCCGGGSIGIAAAVYSQHARVTLADLDADALALAAENVQLHKVADRVELRRGDLWSAVSGQRFDVILANPPYVDADDLATMPAEFHAEPPQGLGSGADGLDMARRILCQAAEFLHQGGLLFLEVGNSWEALDRTLSGLPLTWLDFSEGGHGVLLVQTAELPAISRALEEA